MSAPAPTWRRFRSPRRPVGIWWSKNVNKVLGKVLAAANELVNSLGDDVDRRMSAFHRAVLFMVFAVAAGRSVYGFLQPSPAATTEMDLAAWVYLALAVITALSLVVHEKLARLRTVAFALPTMALGASFVVLDFRTRLGWIIVLGTAAAATPLIVHELLRGCARRAPDVPED